MSMASVTAARRPGLGRLGSTICLGLGGAVLLALWFGPLLPLSRVAFVPHMLLHLGIVVVAGPLLGLGLALRLPPIARFGDALSWCLLASFFELVAVWGWHVPLLHDLAGHSDLAFALEQMSFVLAGLVVWTAAFACRTSQTAPAAMIGLFLTFAHMSMFGLILTLVPTLIYDPSLCGGAFGFSKLDDQHLGGILMAVGGGLPYLGGTAWAGYRMLARG